MESSTNNQEDFQTCICCLKMAVHRHGVMQVLKLAQFYDAIELSNDRHSLLKVKLLCEQHGSKLVLEALQAIAQEYQEIARHDYNLVCCAVIDAEHARSKKKEKSERLNNCQHES